MKHKKLFISLISVATLVAALCVFLLTWFTADKYEDFEEFRKEFEIPALKSGLTPQGLGNYGSTFFVSGYYSDGKPSRIYAVKHSAEESRALGYFTMTVNGENYVGHCGGVATDGKHMWVTSDDTVYVLDYEAVQSAIETGASVEITSSFDAMCNASFCYYYQPSGGYGRLYVGEFYRPKNYETDERHHIKLPYDDGREEYNRAIVYQYRVLASGQTNDYGLKLCDSAPQGFTPLPAVERVYSLPDKIQGFARTETGYVLSQSWGLANSKIFYYAEKGVENSRKSDTDFRVDYKYGDSVTSERVYLYYMYDGNLTRTYSIPSMSEGLCTYGGRVYVLFESAGKKYRTFVREKLKNVYSFSPTAN